MIGTDASIAIVGRIFSTHRITIIEDDYKVIKILGDLTYPFTETILCPNVCDVGKWNYKKIGYNGFMKLAYLHPNIFKKQNDVIAKYRLPLKFSIIRLSNLAAYHDRDINGLNHNFLIKIIELLQSYSISVFITTEAKIDNIYSEYLLKINPKDMHQILAHSSILISDSQSMSVEASILGVPSIRISSFVGRISVLEELEKKYKLTFGVSPENYEEVLNKIHEILSMKNFATVFSNRKLELLKEKIDVNQFLTWFIENYPKSIKEAKIKKN
jgi:predicted glycosyltransferase